ncbi:hypothetical protein ABBQ32_004137 [Trebouxia sp. C0010 RCD-2024]
MRLGAITATPSLQFPGLINTEASGTSAPRARLHSARRPISPASIRHCTQHKLQVTSRHHSPREHVGCSAHAGTAVGHAPDPPPAGSRFGPLFPHFQKSKHDADITQLAVPALFSLLLDPVMSLVDCAIVGRLGADALAATGASISIFSLAGLLVSFLSYVTVPAVAEASTQGDSAEVSRVISTGVWIAVVAGVFITGFIIAIGPLILGSMRLEASVVEKATGYVWARALGSIGYLLVLVGSGSFRGMQDTMTPAIASLASVLTNFSLDVVFVFVFGWGVTGAGAATSIGMGVNALVLYSRIIQKRLLKPTHLLQPPTWGRLRPMLRTGVALQIRNGFLWFVGFLGARMAAEMGTVTMAAHEIIRQMWVFSLQGFAAINVTAQSLLATHLGNDDCKSAREVMQRLIQIALVAGSFIALTLALPRDQLPLLFSSDVQVVEKVRRVMPLVVLMLPLDAVERTLEGGLLGCQQTDFIARNTLVSAAACMSSLLLVYKLQLGFSAVWIATKVLILVRFWGGFRRLSGASSPIGDVRESAP